MEAEEEGIRTRRGSGRKAREKKIKQNTSQEK